ncbi:MAG: RNA 2',3'-cyclic phosphodiesterase [Anaerolineae bacterium]
MRPPHQFPHDCRRQLFLVKPGVELTAVTTRRTNNIRAFIAIHLPDDVKEYLEGVTETLAGQAPRRSVRWVKPALLHLTMRFLGDTPVSQLPRIAVALDSVAAAHAPFEMRLDQLGCFPNRKWPRVIWVGLSGELEPLRTLKKGIDACLAPLGWEPEDRPFRAHLTLGRVKDSRGLAGSGWGAEVEPLSVPVTAVHLVESQLRPTGPIYTVRHVTRLGG